MWLSFHSPACLLRCPRRGRMYAHVHILSSRPAATPVAIQGGGCPNMCCYFDFPLNPGALECLQPGTCVGIFVPNCLPKVYPVMVKPCPSLKHFRSCHCKKVYILLVTSVHLMLGQANTYILPRHMLFTMEITYKYNLKLHSVTILPLLIWIGLRRQTYLHIKKTY